MGNINNPDYTHYVVAGGKIESGWESKEDATEHKKENLHSKVAGVAKIVAKSALNSRHGIDPENDQHWHDQASLNKLTESLDVSPMRALTEGNLYEFGRSLKQELTERAKHVLANVDMKSLLEFARARALLEFNYDHPEYSHFVIGRGKIISGHSSLEAAGFRHSRMPLKIQRDAKVVSRDQLKKPFFDPSNNEHWAKPHELVETTLGDYIRNSSVVPPTHYVVATNMGRKSIFSQQYSEEAAKKGADFENHASRHYSDKYEVVKAEDMHKHGLDPKNSDHWDGRKGVIAEQEDQPDNAVDPLSREAVKSLFKDYKRNVAPSQNNDDVEAHSEDGKTRAGDHSHAADPEPAKHSPGA